MDDYQRHQEVMRDDVGSEFELRELLDEAVNSLADADRTAVFHRFFKGQSYKEIGEVLGKREDTCQKQLTRALAKLGRFFEKRGVTTSSVALASLLASEFSKAAPIGLGKTFAESVVSGTITLTKTQMTMYTIQSVIHSKFIVGACAAAAAAGVGWLAIAHADEPEKQVESEPETKRRIILPPGAPHADAEPFLNGGNVEVAVGRVRENPTVVEAVLSVSLDQGEVIAEIKDVQALLGALILFSADHNGSYPGLLSDLVPKYISDSDRLRYLFFECDSQPPHPVRYVTGLSDGVSGKTPLVALPVLIEGKRVVGYAGGSASIVREVEFQSHLRDGLKAYPEARWVKGVAPLAK